MTYPSGFLTPVEQRRRDEYVAAASAAWPLFREYGALRQLEAWGNAVPTGAQTDFTRAVALTGRPPVPAWRWKSDTRFPELPMPFDGTRMVHGGFATMVDEQA